jgi:hypothetical protein
MPKGSRGEKRPGDVVGAAVMVAKIATGEIEENQPAKGREGGLAGGQARASSLTPEQRRQIAKKAAESRWRKGQAAPAKKEHA